MTTREKRHGLSDADRELWKKVTANIDPITAPPMRQPTLPTSLRDRPLPMPAPLEPFRIGEKASRAPTVGSPTMGTEAARNVSARMDKRSFDRLKKGRLRVEGRIDLHGMTLADAHPALNAFVQKAYADEKRLLLVITGKGDAGTAQGIMPSRRGVLRQQVPQWLRMPPLDSMILEITPATQKHGGQGAVYVYLKRQR